MHHLTLVLDSLRSGAGAENARQILELAEQSTDESNVSEDDSKWLLSTIEVALKQAAVSNDNGARAVRLNYLYIAAIVHFLTVLRCVVSETGIGIDQVGCRQRREVC